MRSSRFLARRLAMFEALLRDAKTDPERARIMRAIAEIRGNGRRHTALREHGDRLAECLAIGKGGAR